MRLDAVSAGSITAERAPGINRPVAPDVAIRNLFGRKSDLGPATSESWIEEIRHPHIGVLTYFASRIRNPVWQGNVAFHFATEAPPQETRDFFWTALDRVRYGPAYNPTRRRELLEKLTIKALDLGADVTTALYLPGGRQSAPIIEMARAGFSKAIGIALQQKQLKREVLRLASEAAIAGNYPDIANKLAGDELTTNWVCVDIKSITNLAEIAATHNAPDSLKWTLNLFQRRLRSLLPQYSKEQARSELSEAILNAMISNGSIDAATVFFSNPLSWRLPESQLSNSLESASVRLESLRMAQADLISLYRVQLNNSEGIRPSVFRRMLTELMTRAQEVGNQQRLVAFLEELENPVLDSIDEARNNFRALGQAVWDSQNSFQMALQETGLPLFTEHRPENERLPAEQVRTVLGTLMRLYEEIITLQCEHDRLNRHLSQYMGQP